MQLTLENAARVYPDYKQKCAGAGSVPFKHPSNNYCCNPHISGNRLSWILVIFCNWCRYATVLLYRCWSLIYRWVIISMFPLSHGDIILNRSNNSYISIETSAPLQAGDFIIKQYFGISNIAARRQKRFPIGCLANNRCPMMFIRAKISVSYWLSITVNKTKTLNLIWDEGLETISKTM